MVLNGHEKSTLPGHDRGNAAPYGEREGGQAGQLVGLHDPHQRGIETHVVAAVLEVDGADATGGGEQEGDHYGRVPTLSADRDALQLAKQPLPLNLNYKS